MPRAITDSFENWKLLFYFLMILPFRIAEGGSCTDGALMHKRSLTKTRYHILQTLTRETNFLLTNLRYP
jgi:hypothetical protein